MRINSPLCCLLHHDPMSRGVCVCSEASLVCSCGCSCSVVALRIELSAPWLSAEDGQPATGYRVVPSSSYGNRTHLSALKGQYPSPIDERAAKLFWVRCSWSVVSCGLHVVCSAYARTLSVDGAERFFSRFTIFSQVLDRISCRLDFSEKTNKKGPASL